MLKRGETSAAAPPASAAESPKVARATRCTSTPTTAHASRFWDMARIAWPSLVRVTNHSSPAKTATAATSTSGRCQASRTPPTSAIAEDSAVGTSLGWVPNTMMARLVRVMEVASVAMSWTCHVRARIVRITVRS